MKKIKRILSISALLVCGVANTWGQGGQKLTGKDFVSDKSAG